MVFINIKLLFEAINFYREYLQLKKLDLVDNLWKIECYRNSLL